MQGPAFLKFGLHGGTGVKLGRDTMRPSLDVKAFSSHESPITNHECTGQAPRTRIRRRDGTVVKGWLSNSWEVQIPCEHAVDGIFHQSYTCLMSWEVEYTDEFGVWWNELSDEEQESLAASVRLLEERGPTLGFPHSSGINGSKHHHMRALRTQHRGRPLRTLYAFDPKRVAILLIGGDKTGADRWYDTYVPIADRLYDEHLEQLRKEGLIDG